MGYKIERDELLRHPTRNAVLTALRKTPGKTPTELSNELSINYNTLMSHIRRLVRVGLIRRERTVIDRKDQRGPVVLLYPGGALDASQ